MLYEQFSDFESQWEKVSQRSIVGRGNIGHNLGSYEGFAWYVLSHMRHFCLGVIFHSVTLLHFEVVRGHDFWTHFKVCMELVDLLPPILDNGTEW